MGGVLIWGSLCVIVCILILLLALVRREWVPSEWVMCFLLVGALAFALYMLGETVKVLSGVGRA